MNRVRSMSLLALSCLALAACHSTPVERGGDVILLLVSSQGPWHVELGKTRTFEEGVAYWYDVRFREGVEAGGHRTFPKGTLLTEVSDDVVEQFKKAGLTDVSVLEPGAIKIHLPPSLTQFDVGGFALAFRKGPQGWATSLLRDVDESADSDGHSGTR
jgi:hypothetical protein